MRVCRLLTLLILPPLLAQPVEGQSSPEPKITFEESALSVTGVPAGGTVVWFGVERRVDEEFSTEVAPHYALEPVQVDGTARLELEKPVVHSSLWVAVDLASGAYAVAVPEGYRIASASLLPHSSPGEGDLSDGILDERPYVFGLVVRPGVGAWQYSGGDGGRYDSDGVVNGQSRFALEDLLDLPGASESLTPPDRSASQDLWVVIDPRRMEISVLKGGVAL